MGKNAAVTFTFLSLSTSFVGNISILFPVNFELGASMYGPNSQSNTLLLLQPISMSHDFDTSLAGYEVIIVMPPSLKITSWHIPNKGSRHAIVRISVKVDQVIIL